MKLVSSLSNSSSVWFVCWSVTQKHIKKLIIPITMLALIMMMLVGCSFKSDITPKTGFNLKVDQKNATITGKVTQMSVGDTLTQLDQQLGIRVRAANPPNTMVNLSFDSQPIQSAVQAIVGADTRFTLDLTWGDVVLVSVNEQKIKEKKGGGPSESRKGFPTKGKTKEIDPEKLKNIKKSGDSSKIVTDGRRGTKAKPVDVEGITKDIPKKAKPLSLTGHYVRVRVEVTTNGVLFMRAWKVAGPFIEPVHIHSGIVLAIIQNGNVIALSSVPDPLIQRSHFPDPTKGHTPYILNKAQAVLSISARVTKFDILKNSEIHIYRIPENSPLHLNVENFRSHQKQLNELGHLNGNMLLKHLNNSKLKR